MNTCRQWARTPLANNYKCYKCNRVTGKQVQGLCQGRGFGDRSVNAKGLGGPGNTPEQPDWTSVHGGCELRKIKAMCPPARLGPA